MYKGKGGKMHSKISYAFFRPVKIMANLSYALFLFPIITNTRTACLDVNIFTANLIVH